MNMCIFSTKFLCSLLGSSQIQVSLYESGSLYIFTHWSYSLFSAFLPLDITVMSHEHHVVSNHRSFDCLLNSLYRPTSEKHRSSHDWPFGRKIHWWLVNSTHKGPVTQKRLPCDDVSWMGGISCLPVMNPFKSWSRLRRPSQYKMSSYQYRIGILMLKMVSDTILSLTWESPHLASRSLYWDRALVCGAISTTVQVIQYGVQEPSLH